MSLICTATTARNFPFDVPVIIIIIIWFFYDSQNTALKRITVLESLCDQMSSW